MAFWHLITFIGLLGLCPTKSSRNHKWPNAILQTQNGRLMKLEYTEIDESAAIWQIQC